MTNNKKPAFSWVKNGEGKDYDYSQDHLYVKVPSSATNGELAIVEDTLKPGFFLARHHHKKMTEIFFVVEGQVQFIFDGKTITTDKGDTISVPPNTWHAAKSTNGGKMLTIFKNGRFDVYLERLSKMTKADFKNKKLMKRVSHEFDIYNE
ncbi:unnamed protein product [Didymodactylos carnosus]|uniref:Cupin type-2 domain-containing protein n=2 Tax=Didymodactylos carnosus TaxID=1234261 RepID=A0A8S2S2H7_9BILA|nr:unnamed protein product [Didymodactylos carnosus]CAF4193828.1 unnamed protein product [Didymodactylos carnosus]